MTFQKNQNFWQLASIQSASMGLPVILVGGRIANEFGPGIAISSVLIGNLILWLIALVVIGMTDHRINAIENVGDYLGKWGKFAFAITVGIAFLGWYTLQSKVASIAIGNFLELGIRQELRIGSILGILASMIAMGSIRLIKWICVISLPILMLFFLVLILITSDLNYKNYAWGLSFTSILSVIIIVLPGVINLPTFFRHSKSKPHSFFALTIMFIFYSLFQCFCVLLKIGQINDLLKFEITPFFIISFILISLFCINLVNIYFASAVWEAVVRRAADAKDYAVIGLIGTGAFALLQALPAMTFLENTVNGFIASLGIVLITVFLIRIIVSHRPRLFEKIISNSCWFIGCFASFMALIRNPQQPNIALLVGVGSSALSFLIVIFIEETKWAFNNSSIRKKI